MEKVSIGDIVHVVKKDGKEFDCFVVESIGSNQEAFYGRYLQASKDKVATASWSRYGLRDNGICVCLEDCASISVISKGSKQHLAEDINGVCYSNRLKDGTPICFCLLEGYGGWSFDESDKDSALLEAYSRFTSSKEDSSNGI